MKKGPGGVGLPTYASTPSDRKSWDGRGMGRYVSSKGRVRMGSCGSGSVGGLSGILLVFFGRGSGNSSRLFHMCRLYCALFVSRRKGWVVEGLYDDRNVAH